MQLATTVATDGQRRVNCSDIFSDVVATVSAIIARARNTKLFICVCFNQFYSVKVLKIMRNGKFTGAARAHLLQEFNCAACVILTKVL